MRCIIVLLAMVSFPCLAKPDPVESSDDAVVSFGAETDMNSRYIWRGIILDDQLVIQPAVSISVQHMAFSIWNNHVPQEVRLIFSFIPEHIV